MEVTVDDDEAKTRVKDVYTVSAPIAGKVLRNPREVGDQVTADETVVAVMQPMRPSFLDVRSRGSNCRHRWLLPRRRRLSRNTKCTEIRPRWTSTAVSWKELKN